MTAATQSDPEGHQVLDFSLKKVRTKFVRKVYSTLMLLLVTTCGIITTLIFYDPLIEWIGDNFYFSAAVDGALAVLGLSVSCSKKARRTFPLNFILLVSFSIVQGSVLGFISCRYETFVILLAMGIITVACFALLVFAFATEIDIVGDKPYEFLLTLFFTYGLLIYLGVVPAPFRTVLSPFGLIFSSLAALIFAMFIIHRTQCIVSGSHNKLIPPDEYVFAALVLYLDVCEVFMDLIGDEEEGESGEDLSEIRTEIPVN